MITLLALILSADPTSTYTAKRTDLDAYRATSDDTHSIADARAHILRFYDEAVFPSWEGTPWAFSGTSQTPREGEIACGYYVTTSLEHAGFNIERVRLAQQASLNIVKTMAGDEGFETWRFLTPAEVIVKVRKRWPKGGLFIVGLDFHVGFLRLTKDDVKFCHSSVLPPKAVICEDPVTAAAFSSNLYVVGNALPDARVRDWLNGRAILTAH